MRIFIALDVEDSIRQRIARFMEGVRGFAPDVRWVRSERMHITLKVIGEKPPEAVEEINRALSAIQMGPVEIAFRGYGFSRSANAPRVLRSGIESGPQLAELAGSGHKTFPTV